LIHRKSNSEFHNGKRRFAAGRRRALNFQREIIDVAR